MYDDLTEETKGIYRKAATEGFNTSTGVTGYDLTEVIRLTPVVTPVRKLIARKQSPEGGSFTQWRALLDVTDQQLSPFTPKGESSSETLVDAFTFRADYKALGKSGFATQDAFDEARGYVDVYAESVFATTNAYLIAEDRALFGAQSWNLSAVTAGDITLLEGTGGSVPTGTYTIGVAARTAQNYYYGGNSQGATKNITVGAADATITASVKLSGSGVVAYDWFIKKGGATQYYYGTTVVPSIVINKNPTADALPNLPGIFRKVPTLDTAADNHSGDPTAFNGLLSSITADYNPSGEWVTPGTGTPNPSSRIDLNGAPLTAAGNAVAEISELFLKIYEKVASSPTALLVNPLQAQAISNLILSKQQAYTVLTTDSSGRIDVTGGGHVATIVNAASGGSLVPLIVARAVPPGTIVAVTKALPEVPDFGNGNTATFRTLRDTALFNYDVSRKTGPNSGPRKEFEIRSYGTFANYAPVAYGVLENVGIATV